MLPGHGRLNCRKCFNCNENSISQPHSKWKMVNDPGHWGSAEPEVLVLGFSKGATQAETFRIGKHEEVAFARMRPRLESALKAIDILEQHESIDDKISSPDSNIAFASLVRCSLTRVNEAASRKQGQEVFSSSGSLITKSFREVPSILLNCTHTYLTELPASLKRIVFLGCSNGYVIEVKQLIRQLYSESFHDINDMAFNADGRIWIFVAHPSPANGTFNKWLTENVGIGEKRAQACAALGKKPLVLPIATRTRPGANSRGASLQPDPNNMGVTMPTTQAPGFNTASAYQLLNSQLKLHGETKKISCFDTRLGKQIALQREGQNAVQVWIEADLQDPRDIGLEVKNRSNPGMPYAANQSRNSNLNQKTAPRLAIGRAVWNVVVPTEAALVQLLTWYK